MKKVKWMFISLLMLIAAACLCVHAEEEITITESGECGEAAFWKLDSEGTLTVFGEGRMTDFESRYQQPWYGKQLNKLVIEEGITHIGEYAFADRYISQIYFPNSIESVGYHGFQGAKGFGGVYIDSVESWLRIDFVGPNANPLFEQPVLYVDGKKLTYVTIPESITEIKRYAFYNYTLLDRVVFHEGVTSIGDTPFLLKYMDAVVPAGSYAHEWCVENEVVYYLTSGSCGDNVSWSVDGDGLMTISGTGAMNDYRDYSDTAGRPPWSPIRELVKSVKISEGITRIGDYAFQIHNEMTGVVIPDSVESIGTYAFAGCSSLCDPVALPAKISRIEPYTFYNTDLQGVVIPDGVTYIGGYAFANTEIAELLLPDAVETIGSYAFWGCSNLEKVVLPSKLTSIPEYAFKGCSSLSSVVFPEGLVNIYSDAFGDCVSLDSISLPASVQRIRGAFSGCDGLRQVHVPSIEWWLSLSFAGGGSPFQYADEMYVNGEPVKEIIVPDTVTEINDGAFSYMSFLSSVVIPDSVTSIGSEAFYRCANLEEVEFSDKLLKIDDWAFADCDSLKSVSLPDGLVTLGESAFEKCDSLESVYIPGTAGYISDSCFYSCDNLKEVILGEGITSIHNMAFCACYSLESIRLPDSLRMLDSYVFSSSGLKSLELPQNLEIIGSDAFSYCSGLTCVTIPENVRSIGYYAFEDCINLEWVFFLGKEISFAYNIFRGTDSPTFYCFHGCTAVDYISQQASDEEELSYAYMDAGEDVLCLPEAVTSVGDCAFEGMTSISVILPDGCESIASRAFANNLNLAFVYMPDTVISIADDAFEECSKVFFLCESENAAAAYAEAHNIPFGIA